MTRQPHDQFAKQYLEELLSPFGKVEVSREVRDETRQVDLIFSPASPPTAESQNLGLLGRIATTSCLLEPFRNQPSKTEVRNCILKLFSYFAERQRQARRDRESLAEDSLPRLWILAPSASPALLTSFGAKLEENWDEGVYFLPEACKTAIIAINQLPTTPETLWLRILGRGETQRNAIEQLLSLPSLNPLRQAIQELITSWRIAVISQDNLTEDDQELLMNLAPAYLQWREATRQEARQEGLQEGLQEGIQAGLQQGIQQGQRVVIENLLRVRFGAVDEELARVIDALLQLPPAEYTRLCVELSREELLTRFS